MSEAKEKQALRRYLAIQQELSPGETEISRTLDNIAVIKAGWHRVRNAAGDWSYFPNVPKYPPGSPEQRALEERWQEGALGMHANQTLILPEPKPRENAMTRIRRGD